MTRTVLIVTKSTDNASVSKVRDALTARGAQVFRLDTDRFPTEVELALYLPRGAGAPRSWLRDGDSTIALEDIAAVWYRRAAIAAQLPTAMDAQDRSAALKEARATLIGALDSLPCPTIDRISIVRAAEHKPRQLLLAAAAGLDVPRTLTTNDPDAVRAFFAACGGRVVAKTLSSFAIHDESGREQVVFTTALAEADLAHLDQLALSPMTFQEHLAKAIELRVTLIDDRLFTAAVESQKLERARVDWRKEGAQLIDAWRPYELPATVADGLRRVAAGLGLRYGAADIVVTPDGRHVFLEINPSGEWFWLDDVFGPRALSGALADALLR